MRCKTTNLSGAQTDGEHVDVTRFHRIADVRKFVAASRKAAELSNCDGAVIEEELVALGKQGGAPAVVQEEAHVYYIVPGGE
jgi:hypothetical protein